MYSREQRELASDIVRVLSVSTLQSYEDLARKLGVGRGLAAELAARLTEYRVCRTYTVKRRKMVGISPNLENCDIRTQETWVLGALNRDM